MNQPTRRLLILCSSVSLLSGCMSLPRATCSDEAFADYIHTQAQKLPLPGLYELRTTAAGGHVTMGGRVDSPETLRQLVTTVASTPGLCELSFFGMEFCPPDIPDKVIAANARAAAAQAIGEKLASQLGYYCEDHFLTVYGTLPSLPLREQLEAAVRAVAGVGLYHLACEVVLQSPPSDEQVVAAVRRKLRSPFELPNLTFRASQIEVASNDNVVTLSGRAPTLLGKLSAGAQAAQVEGVRYVVNRIVVPGVPPSERLPECGKPQANCQCRAVARPTQRSLEPGKAQEMNPPSTVQPANAETVPNETQVKEVTSQDGGEWLILTGQEDEPTPNTDRSSDERE